MSKWKPSVKIGSSIKLKSSSDSHDALKPSKSITALSQPSETWLLLTMTVHYLGNRNLMRIDYLW